MTTESTELLTAALKDHALELPADQIDRIDRYAGLLWSWNERLNLTRHTSAATFVARDVWDAVHLAPLLDSGERVLDVGTGGGTPGILLAILRPDLDVSLCDSVAKKAKAVSDMVTRLELDCPVFHGRAERVLEDLRFDTLVARAVGPLWKMLTWFEPHWASMGRLLVVKGPKWVDERGEARHRGKLSQLNLRCAATYAMPGTESNSVVLELTAKQRRT